MASKVDRGLVLGWVVASAVFVWRAWPSFWTTVDDAWISARYARMLAAGWGPVYSPDEPPVEGFTNLLWTLWLAVGELAGIEPYTFMCGSGLMFGIGTIGVAMGFTHALIGRSTWWPLLTAFVLALNPHLMIVATNGLESSMFMCMTVGASWAILRVDGRWRYLAGVLLAGSALVRPEGLALAGTWMLYDLYMRRERLKQLDTWAVAGALVAVLGSATVWRLLYYGNPVPNTFAAKARGSIFTDDNLWVHNLSYLANDGALWPTAAVVCVLSMVVPGDRLVRAVPVGIALLWAFVAINVEMWMPGSRLFLQGYVLAMPAAVAAIARLRFENAIVAGGVVALMAGSLTLYGTRKARIKDARHSTLPNNQTQIAADFLSKHLPRGEWVVVRDAGVWAYWSGTHVNVWETHYRALTRLHPNYESIDVSDAPRSPAVLVNTVQRVHRSGPKYTNDRKMLEQLEGEYIYLGRAKQHFHRYYDIFVRADLNLPPLPPEAVINRRGESQMLLIGRSRPE